MPTVAAVLEFPARKAPPRRHRADRTFLTREELGRLMAAAQKTLIPNSRYGCAWSFS